ncbi:ribosome-associated ATPase/putative transporter RbbA [Aliiglaciecola sp. 2_MG-2023]|uniref:ribosome-associated ATPase/putative transporter RbbA n=1 Tax=unclassified Aliiglaciecola TaxID=2593648 RepID=UPI0026E3D41A|nr:MULTISPECIES: ribosome-associated ATPase/putative transporter RbbA [unclassified Aliiglaciecola]MDO6710553.1 ribosome-associated ATPase/putative transporter RbbA [Aliiglaciecola sp. 2_MG-2023]MDO6751582.1 ribosome-associated ATPase/putative transporter RbbA [Aliiglaciecola sp. 1_MG-2023]
MESAKADTQSTVAKIRDVRHIYKNTLALDGIELDIPSGVVIGLLGPDGVGKSTLLSLIAGARKLQQGQLEVLGGDMGSQDHRNRVGPRIAFMPQGLGKNLYSELSIEENLDFFGKLFDLSAAQRKSRIKKLTLATGLNSFLDRPAGKLSGGMKQKLGLCCSLIHNPDLLILDEPTTGVDPLSRRQFWQLIANIRQERPSMTVVVSTAYMDEAEGFDWLVAMNNGVILETGTPNELKTKTGTDNLEAAFVKLLPEDIQKKDIELVIPPFEQSDATPAIVAEGLTRKFGDFTAVNKVSFDIQAGEIFGFLGSNGCGKTTTMKMLTGLLPASEGKAFLFGQAVDASDLETRKRVGFMSQGFSLYGELSIEENLILHAKLFHLPRTKMRNRIDSLLKRFALEEFRASQASSLPLGIRQRLSLAVAVIHEPEILILDEPTSGVDPVARDGFWELLIELSRRDKVTIFISTHFMNEAMRCDRISLMHAGQVLVCDTPQNLVAEKAADSLEDAFIEYIQAAIGESQTSDKNSEMDVKLDIASDLPSEQEAHVPPKKFSLFRLFAYSFLESKQVIRDPIRLAFAFLGSAILLVVIAYGISLDVEDLTFAVLDHDQTPQSRQYISNFQGSRYFIEKGELHTQEELELRLKSNDITLAIVIPPGFGRDLKKGETPSVSAWIDGANTTRAGTIEGYVAGGHIKYLTLLATEAGIDASAYYNVTLESRYRYNPSFETIYSIGPKTPAMLLLLFPAILMAVSISREKEIGTITNFYVTPTSTLEFLIGKQLPYICIGLINFFILTLMVVFLLQVPLKGSLLGLSLGALFYVCASTGFGLLISSMTKSQVAAIFATTVLSVMPTIQYSGIIQPTSTLEGIGQFIGSLWPATYYMHMSVAAFTKGLSFNDLAQDLFILAIFGPLFVLMASVILKKQEA